MIIWSYLLTSLTIAGSYVQPENMHKLFLILVVGDLDQYMMIMMILAILRVSLID